MKETVLDLFFFLRLGTGFQSLALVGNEPSALPAKHNLPEAKSCDSQDGISDWSSTNWFILGLDAVSGR